MSQPEKIKKEVRKKRRSELLNYFVEVTKEQGFLGAVRRTLQYLKRRLRRRKDRFMPSAALLRRQRETDIAGWPKISVCVPVYNPPRYFLDQFIGSVVAQSYPNWELCLANASDAAGVVNELLKKYDDARIITTEMENLGIAENTNAAATLASGQYIAFADHDDVVAPHALFTFAETIARTEAAFLYSDEALFDTDHRNPTAAHLKPDYAPQYLLNCNYIGHMVVVRKDIFYEAGKLRPAFDGSQDYDFNLRAIELVDKVVHIPRVLYYWRQHDESSSTGVAAKPYVEKAGKLAIQSYLDRIGVRGTVQSGLFPSTYKVDYAIQGRPLISIIIPNYEHLADLDKCLKSIYEKTEYRHFEVLIVENNSKTVETFAYYQKVTELYPNCKVLVYEEKGFNFSKICNFGRQSAKGDYLLFLNNDTEVITPQWLEEMVQLCQLSAVGATGAMLYYPDDTVQHAGVVVGLGGYAGHSHKYAQRGKSGYMFRQACVQELSAVTAACMMVKTQAFDELDGFDPAFSVAFNNVDFCLRLYQHGYSVVFTPYAELYHYESKSRGQDNKGAAAKRFASEQKRLLDLHETALANDPFYNPNLTKDREDFSENDILPED